MAASTALGFSLSEDCSNNPVNPMMSSHPFFKASVPSRSHANTLFTSILSLLIGALFAGAQTLTTLHSFLAPSEGATPRAGLILSGSCLFGTTTYFSGSVFRLNTDGTGFTNLYRFTGGADGSEPAAPLMLSGDTLYGTTVQGGVAGNGTVFKLNTNGTGFTVLHSFSALTSSTNYDGATPYGGLVLSGNVLYGDAQQGGADHDGTIFAVNTDGSGFTTLDNTGGGSGGNPNVALTLSGSALYGTASYGGNGNAGAVFRLNTDGSDFVPLHVFDSSTDGAHPYGSLLLSGDTLYGTTEDGGASGKGTVFRVNVDGSGFALLHTFSGADGATPQAQAALILSGSTLFGTTASGGVSNDGTIYAVNTDGSGFATLYSFTGGSDGSSPRGALIASGETLFGTTAYGGGTGGYGTVFALKLSTVSPVRLGFSAQNGRLVLAWTDPTLTLQAAPSITGSWTNMPNASSPYTNPPINSQMFFRLIH